MGVVESRVQAPDHPEYLEGRRRIRRGRTAILPGGIDRLGTRTDGAAKVARERRAKQKIRLDKRSPRDDLDSRRAGEATRCTAPLRSITLSTPRLSWFGILGRRETSGTSDRTTLVAQSRRWASRCAFASDGELHVQPSGLARKPRGLRGYRDNGYRRLPARHPIAAADDKAFIDLSARNRSAGWIAACIKQERHRCPGGRANGMPGHLRPAFRTEGSNVVEKVGIIRCSKGKADKTR